MPYFSGEARRIVEALVYDPALEPGFELIKGCLIWADERPMGLDSANYEKLCDLWVARSFVHRGVPFTSHHLAPDYFGRVWSLALADGFSWPGFRRLELSIEDRIYYEACLRECEEGNPY